MLKKPVFEKRNADWLGELPSVIKKHNTTIHSPTKRTPLQTSKKVNEKIVFSNFQDRTDRQQAKYKLGQLVRTADIEKVFSKGDSTNGSYKLYKIAEIIHDTIPRYRFNCVPERYNQNLLLPTKLILGENNKVLNELIVFQ